MDGRSVVKVEGMSAVHVHSVLVMLGDDDQVEGLSVSERERAVVLLVAPAAQVRVSDDGVRAPLTAQTRVDVQSGAVATVQIDLEAFAVVLRHAADYDLLAWREAVRDVEGGVGAGVRNLVVVVRVRVVEHMLKYVWEHFEILRV